MNDYSQVRHWVDELPKRGKTTFSLIEAECLFPGKPVASTRRALARLSSAGKIHSVWKGFYAISLPEYGLESIAPPIDYIDQLMNHLGSQYYIALLSAASYMGAAHQMPQVFQVICDKNLHTKNKNGVIIEPVYKKRIPGRYTTMINTRTASVKISSPELTALDLVAYTRRAGGINQVATVLSELVESIDFGRVDSDFFAGEAAATVQRLGYLLDETLEKKVAANSLYEKARQATVRFRQTPLVNETQSGSTIIGKNAKWDIIVNYEVESDL